MEASALWFQLNALHFIVYLLVCDEFHGLAQVVRTALQAKDVTLNTAALHVLHNRLTSLERHKCHSGRDDTFLWFGESKEIVPFLVQMNIPNKSVSWRDPDKNRLCSWVIYNLQASGRKLAGNHCIILARMKVKLNICSPFNYYIIFYI